MRFMRMLTMFEMNVEHKYWALDGMWPKLERATIFCPIGWSLGNETMPRYIHDKVIGIQGGFV